jgi:hypothetical protein
MLVGVLITFLVVILILYLINLLPIDGRAKQICRIVVIILGVISLLKYIAVFWSLQSMREAFATKEFGFFVASGSSSLARDDAFQLFRTQKSPGTTAGAFLFASAAPYPLQSSRGAFVLATASKNAPRTPAAASIEGRQQASTSG